MASLVLGAVGGYFFGPIGWMVGSAIGTLLDPGKGSEGPRLTDKHLTGSSYGEPIPIVYGQMRLAGQVIWTTPLVEHKHKSGGKGGPSVTTYTYTASFDVLICESNGNAVVIGVEKVWADGNLIYDLTPGSAVDNSKIPVTFYYGASSQLADPTEEAIEGAGNVPAYRGMCRAVFADWDLGTFGNRIPQLTFQVFTSSGAIPWRVSTFDAWAGIPAYSIRASFANGIIYSAGNDSPYPTYYQSKYAIDGVQIGTTTAFSSPGMQDVQVYPSNKGVQLYYVAGGGTQNFWYTPDLDTGALIQGEGVNPQPTLTGRGMVASGEFIYGIGSDGTFSTIVQISYPNGVPGQPTGLTYALDALYTADYPHLGTSDTGHIYCIVNQAGPTAKMWQLDPGLNLIHFWTTGDCAGTQLPTGYGYLLNFHVYKGMVCFNSRVGPHNYDKLVQIDPVSFALSDTGVALDRGGAHATINLNGGLMLDGTGAFSLDPPPGGVPLSSIVSDISQRSGLASTQFDVSQLTDIVPGYVITRQSSGVDNISQLRQAYFFDAVESSASVRFVKRGAASAVTIVDNDLAAQAGTDGDPPPLITVKRTQEVDLPATLYVNYLNAGASYQQGSQYARRLVTNSAADARIDLSIALPDDDARTIASKNLFTAWMERNTFTFNTSRKHAKYEPTDVAVVHGYQLRITDKRATTANVIEFDGVSTSSGPFLLGSVGIPGSGYVPPFAPTVVYSYMTLLDIPLVLDTDYANGYYAALAPQSAEGGWSSASVFKSVDGGTAYTEVASLGVAGTIGTCTTILDNFTGGNLFDEGNSVTVVILGGSAALASATEDAVLNGANLCAIGTDATGWEIVQFKNATLIAAQTYVLTGLLRGRKGSEPYISTHAIRDQFTMLGTTVNINGPFSELSTPLKFKGLTAGQTLAEVNPVTFGNDGVALKPYAPVQLGGGRNAAVDITINWTRRTRIGGAWLPYIDVPLGETIEGYQVKIYSDVTYATVKSTWNITGVASLNYTAAAQVVDFGLSQSTLYFSVAQLGSYGYGTPARGVI